jgi:hypothetical protein
MRSCCNSRSLGNGRKSISKQMFSLPKSTACFELVMVVFYAPRVHIFNRKSISIFADTRARCRLASDTWTSLKSLSTGIIAPRRETQLVPYVHRHQICFSLGLPPPFIIVFRCVGSVTHSEHRHRKTLGRVFSVFRDRDVCPTTSWMPH